MAEVLARFDIPLSAANGVTYLAQACGGPNADGLWEGWIEFLPVEGGSPLRSPRETTQPNRTDTEYWATGLSETYLEGALERALNPPVKNVVPPAQPLFTEPAPPLKRIETPRVAAEAVLDPYSVYEKGERILRQELGALSAWHLVNIVIAYGLSEEPAAVLNAIPSRALVELIVSRVAATTIAGSDR